MTGPENRGTKLGAARKTQKEFQPGFDSHPYPLPVEYIWQVINSPLNLHQRPMSKSNDRDLMRKCSKSLNNTEFTDNSQYILTVCANLSNITLAFLEEM